MRRGIVSELRYSTIQCPLRWISACIASGARSSSSSPGDDAVDQTNVREGLLIGEKREDALEERRLELHLTLDAVAEPHEQGVCPGHLYVHYVPIHRITSTVIDAADERIEVARKARPR